MIKLYVNSIKETRRREVEEIAEEIKCEYPGYTSETIEAYMELLSEPLNPLELLYLLDLLNL